MENIVFLCDSRNGVYIPKIMVERLFNAGWTNITKEDVNYFNNADPQDDLYWDRWIDITDKTEYVDGGIVFTLHHDGDLFAVAWDELTADERLEFFGY